MVKREIKILWFRKIILAISVFFFVLFPSLSIATTIQVVTFRELLQYSEFIFEGQVIAIESVIPPNSHLPRTCVLIEVKEIFKGRHPEDTVDLCFLGGISGGHTVRVANMQYPELDERGIYFVKSLARQYANPLYGWKQGHFLIETDHHTSIEHVLTADQQPVTGTTLEEAPSYGFSTGVAIGVTTTDRLQTGKTLTVEEFKRNLRLMLNVLE
ncbi:MAG: hypothetical protein JSW04_03365 [Desulfobacterales bacterium]|nr:MAG: hypothetical protein JSW04_03365 [Desulfobacterales bacterium]